MSNPGEFRRASSPFEKVAALLDDFDLVEWWDAAPALNVAFCEEGLKESRDSNSSGVGGGTQPITPRAADLGEYLLVA